MVAKLWSNIFVPIAVFVMAAGIVYFAIGKWRVEPPEKKAQHTIEGIQGLNEGDVVTLPALTRVSGETVNLNEVKEKQLLCVFFTPSCAGCVKDADLWRDLNEEAAKKGVAFYIVDVGNDRGALENFIEAYKLDALPVLLDPNYKVGPALKINFVPQYVLFESDGRVLHRWDGVRGYNRETGQKQLAEFFPSRGDLP